MKIRFQTLGCKLNFAETSEIGKQLIAAGHEKVSGSEQADVCVINTCSVTDVADQKGRHLIHRMHRENPEALIIVTGCYAQLRHDEIAAIEGVSYVLGANDKNRIAELVAELGDQGTAHKALTTTATETETAAEQIVSNLGITSRREETPFHPAYSKDDRTRCFLKVQDGCDYFCTYCTIPNARGRSRNATIAETVAQAEKALREGAKEIVLTGVNIGDFGKSTGETFLGLLQGLDAIAGYEYRIRISSCEPNLLSDEVIDFVAASRHFAPHFHIPLQSGSNEVLRIMKRHYTRELFAERIARIRRVMPNAFIGVDCMVGVRGETREHFEDYKAFIDSLSVTQLHVFPYSERANTRMVEMDDLCRVAPTEQKRRVRELMAISKAHTEAFYQSQQGREAVVLWEGKREKSDEGEPLMAGWTENYVRVTAPYDRALINCFCSICIR